MISVKLLHKKEDETSILIKDSSPAYVNSIRRLILNRVPTMAIEDVIFIENGSALYDEILAHRLGLVLFKTDLRSYIERNKCKCKGAGCARCTLQMTIDVKGPCNVYASDIKTKDPHVTPVYPKMLIVKLLEGQNLKLEAEAILGHGKDHMKFSPGLAYFKGYPTFKIQTFKNTKQCEEVCPAKIIKATGDKVNVTDPSKCILCRACEDISKGKVKVKPSISDFIFTIESWGQLSAKEILTKAVEILDEELSEFESLLKA